MVLDPTRRYTWNTSFSHCTRFSDDIILVDSSPFDSFLMIITDWEVSEISKGAE